MNLAESDDDQKSKSVRSNFIYNFFSGAERMLKIAIFDQTGRIRKTKGIDEGELFFKGMGNSQIIQRILSLKYQRVHSS